MADARPETFAQDQKTLRETARICRRHARQTATPEGARFALLYAATLLDVIADREVFAKPRLTLQDYKAIAAAKGR